MPPRKADRETARAQDAPYAQEAPYAQDVARTEAAQAAFFREQADRHRRAVARERTFADLAGGDAGHEHEIRARHLETWATRTEAVAEAIEAGRRRN